MPHTPTSLFADMLGLLKELEWYEHHESRTDLKCPMCLGYQDHGHFDSCHLQATIALAEAEISKDGQ
jgi:hypothetical protein